MQSFTERDQALSFAWDVGNIAVDTKIKNHKRDLANH